MSYFDEIVKSTNLPEGIDYIQLLGIIDEETIFVEADYMVTDDYGVADPAQEVPAEKLIPLLIIGLDSLYDSFPDGDYKVALSQLAYEMAWERHQEELIKGIDKKLNSEEEK